MNELYIITGGPGVGKTTLIEALAAGGYTIIPEAARAIINEQEKSGGNGVPWKDNRLYTELMLRRSIEDYKAAETNPHTGPVFFDRGIPDSLCHWEMSGNRITAEMENVVKRHRYNNTVFILPPWKEIYATDEARKQNWDEAEYTYHKMTEIYQRYGFQVVIVPKDTVGNRKRFILDYVRKDRLIIRPILPSEYFLMEDMMYEAIYHPDPENPYPKEVIYHPQVREYWDKWGMGKDDHCLVASIGDKIAGAVWIRTFQGEIKGCGYVDEQTPEIAIALFAEYRNQGIGTQLMQQMIQLMKAKCFRQVSLSITKGNPAVRLYERLGFSVINENEEDYIMLLHLI